MILAMSSSVEPSSKVEATAKPYRVLMRIQPRLSPAEAKRLAKIFTDESKRCGVSWRTLAAIAFTESSLGFHRHNPVTHDHGLMQINVKNIERKGLCPKVVRVDDVLSVKIACEILVQNRARYEKKFDAWLGIYRSGTALSKPAIKKNATQYHDIITNTRARIAAYEKDPRT